jgi:hypothetical protein
VFAALYAFVYGASLDFLDSCFVISVFTSSFVTKHIRKISISAINISAKYIRNKCPVAMMIESWIAFYRVYCLHHRSPSIVYSPVATKWQWWVMWPWHAVELHLHSQSSPWTLNWTHTAYAKHLNRKSICRTRESEWSAQIFRPYNLLSNVTNYDTAYSLSFQFLG